MLEKIILFWMMCFVQYIILLLVAESSSFGTGTIFTTKKSTSLIHKKYKKKRKTPQGILRGSRIFFLMWGGQETSSPHSLKYEELLRKYNILTIVFIFIVSPCNLYNVFNINVTTIIQYAQ